ncbi:MAG: hypothetical protein QXS69_01650, partial [Candidatus Aenigmatarchaeota archaeon]
VLHSILHFLIPVILIVLSLIYVEDISIIERIVVIFAGAFIPDIDHFIYLKYIRFTSIKDFLRFNIKSDRYRRGFLLFHNIPTIAILLITVPLLMFYNTLISLFLLAFLIHLIFDFFEDRIIIRVSKHWKFGK